MRSDDIINLKMNKMYYNNYSKTNRRLWVKKN